MTQDQMVTGGSPPALLEAAANQTQFSIETSRPKLKDTKLGRLFFNPIYHVIEKFWDYRDYKRTALPVPIE